MKDSNTATAILDAFDHSGDGLAKTIAQFSGVSTLSTGSGLVKPIIHGMFGSRVGIVYDETVLENQQWGQDHAPNLDANAFDNIRVVKGAATLQYSGDNPGGLVILESKAPSAIDNLFGKTILNATSNNNGLSLLSSLTKSYDNGTYIKAQGTYKAVSFVKVCCRWARMARSSQI